MSYVEGSYRTTQEAIKAVKRLKKEGYKEEDIRLISNTPARNTFMTQSNLDFEIEKEYTGSATQGVYDDSTMWDRMEEVFPTDDNDVNNSTISTDDNLHAYRGDIAAGNIIIVVKGEPVDASNTENNTTKLSNKMTGNEQTIQLQEEQLDVDTNKVQTGKVNVSKRVIKEMRTIEVPVEREEVVIKIKKFDDGTHADGIIDEEEIIIPISEEQIHVSKNAVVTEEVTISKETVEEVKHISDSVKKETLDVDTDGDIQVKDSKDTL